MTLDPQEARQLLEAEQERAEERRRTAQEVLTDDLGAGELNPVTEHPGDNAAQIADREVAQTSLEQAEEDLEEIQSALRRLEEGTYGRCEVDGEPIDPERLRVRPTARYCTTHQQEVEAQT
jgi:RNA polymerase-binding transcription factor DksA